MKNQMIFKRYELKYMLTRRQKELLLEEMSPYMAPDSYGHTSIRNIYYDTDNFRLVRRSIEKPAYKEKLRVRSYGTAAPDSPVFVELKKKYDSVVYKRRLSLPLGEVTECLGSGQPLPVSSQIASEIDYFREFYQGLKPAVYLSYERDAYYMKDGSDFRVTFDENILYRTEDLSLAAEPRGTALLPDGRVLMELKTSAAIPLWLSTLLSREHIYKTSYSKYGTAYCRLMAGEMQQEISAARNTTEHWKGELRYA